MNCRMAELKRVLEEAGFGAVKTVLASGNVALDAPKQPGPALERKLERVMQQGLGTGFLTIVRPIPELEAILASDPWKGVRLPAGAKRVVTFLREAPAAKPRLPVDLADARIHALEGTTAFTHYVPGEDGPVFMTLIERTFGKAQTTRTWQTLEKVARA